MDLRDIQAISVIIQVCGEDYIDKIYAMSQLSPDQVPILLCAMNQPQQLRVWGLRSRLYGD